MEIASQRRWCPKPCLQIFCVVLIVSGATSRPHDGQTQTEGDAGPDFVDMSAPSAPLTWRSRLKVKSLCTTDKMVGVTLHVTTASLDTGQLRDKRTFQTFWHCRGNPDSTTLQIRRVRLTLPDDLAFRPWVFNKNSSLVVEGVAVRVVVWMVDNIAFWTATDEEKRSIEERAERSRSYEVRLAQPYSRPHKAFVRRSVPWFWRLMQTPVFSDRDVCVFEQVQVPLLSYPVVFNGQKFGIWRSVSPFHHPALEKERTESFLKPRFSVEMWVYIVEYCPLSHLNAARACSVFCHVANDDNHPTPCILVDETGLLQVEGSGPGMYVAHKTKLSVPKRQWVRILFALNGRKWTLSWSYGKNHELTQSAESRFASDVFFDATEGLYVLGGIEGRLGSYLGYMANVKMYRRRVMTLGELRLPRASDPVMRLEPTLQLEEECVPFREWLAARVEFYSHRAAVYLSKQLCPYSYTRVMGGHRPDPRLLTCPARPGLVGREEEQVARLLRSAARRDGAVSRAEELVIAGRLLDSLAVSVEEDGLASVASGLPLVQQAACLGSLDATFTLAALLNNGVGAAVQEDKSQSLLMQGAMGQHRLSTLALGHRHAAGLDGVALDREIAYMYYMDVGDKTRGDRETHPADQVLTETVRLMDEKTLEQQTDESGHLFMWLKHQAHQGVVSAQVHLAHLYFWGSSGMQRNMQGARQFFQQGAEQGDMDSVYQLGLMDLLGRGGMKKNATSAVEHLKRAAEKKHPHAISALGWLAMEREKNYTKAAASFETAFRYNLQDAGYYLGHMYHVGIYPNKTKDIDKAVSYYQWAAQRGHVIAALLFTGLQNRGTEKMARNPALAMEWARFIAEQNAVVGKLLRGGVNAYRSGNVALAAYHYLLTAEAGTEVASFNLAWLCEEYKDSVTAAVGKECQWRHYNLTVQREEQFVDPYSYIKMGDYFWYGCQGQRNASRAAHYYAAAGKKKEPHALFNLAFMVEEGAKVPQSVWTSLRLRHKQGGDKLALLLELYERCRESPKGEAFIPCTLALYRVWLLHLWARYRVYVKTSTYAGVAVGAVGSLCLLWQCLARWRLRPHWTFYRL